MEEIWKTIPNYEGYYEVSNFGRVKSLSRTFPHLGGIKTTTQRILANTCNDSGYMICSLCKNGIIERFRVHQLVAKCFLEYPVNQKEKIVIDHINGIRDDNRAENLRYVTTRFNCTAGYTRNKETKSSKYCGVSWHKEERKWSCQIYINGKVKWLGRFKEESEANLAYQNELLIHNNNIK